MKKIVLTISLVFTALHFLMAQCPTHISFTTQAQVDSFPIFYPACTDIRGDVHISQYGITNLNGLSRLHSIGGDCSISFTKLINLGGLGSLKSVDGKFSTST